MHQLNMNPLLILSWLFTIKIMVPCSNLYLNTPQTPNDWFGKSLFITSNIASELLENICCEVSQQTSLSTINQHSIYHWGYHITFALIFWSQYLPSLCIHFVIRYWYIGKISKWFCYTDILIGFQKAKYSIFQNTSTLSQYVRNNDVLKRIYERINIAISLNGIESKISRDINWANDTTEIIITKWIKREN